ncbi:hypothetical protein ACJX0J_006882, partial [Zea mays]
MAVMREGGGSTEQGPAYQRENGTGQDSSAQDKLQYHQPALLPKGKLISSFTEVLFLEQTSTYYIIIFIFFLFAWVFLCHAVTNGWLVISIAKFTLSAISAEGISGIKAAIPLASF